jgi:hypothetical protein
MRVYYTRVELFSLVLSNPFFLLLELSFSRLVFFDGTKRSSLTVHDFTYTENAFWVSIERELFPKWSYITRWPFFFVFFFFFFSVSGFASSQTRWRLFPTLIPYELRLSSDFKESLSVCLLSLFLLSVTIIVGLLGETRIRTASRDHQDLLPQGDRNGEKETKKESGIILRPKHLSNMWSACAFHPQKSVPDETAHSITSCVPNWRTLYRPTHICGALALHGDFFVRKN